MQRAFQPFRRRLTVAMSVAILALAWLFPLSAQAVDKPLLIIRFNQTKVYFEQPLYDVIARAIQAKPSVRFKVLALVPPSSVKNGQASSVHVAGVLDAMRRMGVPDSRVSLDYQSSQGLEHEEAHLFVY